MTLARTLFAGIWQLARKMLWGLAGLGVFSLLFLVAWSVAPDQVPIELLAIALLPILILPAGAIIFLLLAVILEPVLRAFLPGKPETVETVPTGRTPGGEN